MDNCPFFSVSSAFDLPLFAIWTMIMCDLSCKQVLIQGTRGEVVAAGSYKACMELSG